MTTLKHENQIRLARLAGANVWHGGASALVLAERVQRLFPDSEAVEIVNRVYTHPQGRAVYECEECGQIYVTPIQASACAHAGRHEYTQ